MISRKIGLHIINSTTVPLGKPTVVKLMDPSVPYYWQVRQEVGPNCLIVVRFYHKAQPLDNPVANARFWFNCHWPWIQQVPATELVVYEGWNEIGRIWLPVYLQFELERVALLHAENRAACVGNWSSGVPEPTDWVAICTLLNALGPRDVVGLHEYYSDHADLENVYHIRRFTLPEAAAALGTHKVVRTETGRDYTEDTKKGRPGWQLSCNSEEHLEDLRRLGELDDQCPNLVGSCEYQTGSPDPEWQPFNVYGIWPTVVSEYPTAPSVPVETPAPAVTPLKLAPPIDRKNIVRNPDGSPRITQGFIPPVNWGIDYSCIVGRPLYAAFAGRAYRGDQGTLGFGKYVRVEDGKGNYAYTAHMSDILVANGAVVAAGELIGWSGNTGNSTGPHLHFELRRGSRLQASAVDPSAMIVWPLAGSLPNDEQGSVETLVAKMRWWLEEEKRQRPDDPQRADTIHSSLILLAYRVEGML